MQFTFSLYYFGVYMLFPVSLVSICNPKYLIGLFGGYHGMGSLFNVNGIGWGVWP